MHDLIAFERRDVESTRRCVEGTRRCVEVTGRCVEGTRVCVERKGGVEFRRKRGECRGGSGTARMNVESGRPGSGLYWKVHQTDLTFPFHLSEF